MRRKLKEAKKKEEDDAADALVELSPERAANKLKLAMEKKIAEEIAEKARQEEEEVKRRNDRKASLNATWST